MKKKLALLLAAVMTFAMAVPMNLFAAATAENVVSGRIMGHAKGDYFVQRGMDWTTALMNARSASITDSTIFGAGLTEAQSGIAGGILAEADAAAAKANYLGSFIQTVNAKNGLASAVKAPGFGSGTGEGGANLVVRLKDVDASDTDLKVRGFQIDLTNATWNFAAGNGDQLEVFDKRAAAAEIDTQANYDAVAEAITGTQYTFKNADLSEIGLAVNAGQIAPLAADVASTAAIGNVKPGAIVAAPTANEIKTFEAVFVNGSKDFTAQTGGTLAVGDKLSYTMVFANDNKTAFVYYSFAGSTKDLQLEIPLVIKATDGGVISAKVSAMNNEYVAEGTYPVSYAAQGTTTTISATGDGMQSVNLATIKITESGVGSLKTGQFVIVPPEGYKISGAVSGIKAVNLGASATVVVPAQPNPARDDDGYVLELRNITPSSIFSGSIEFTGLVLTPLAGTSTEVDKKLDIKIKNISAGVTEQDIKDAAVFVTYGLKYEYAKEIAIPEIKAGRQNQALKTGDDTIKVVIEEKAPNSLWAAKDTHFILTDANGQKIEGVKITSVKVKTTNFVDALDNLVFYSAGRNSVNQMTGWLSTKSAPTTDDGIIFDPDATGFYFSSNAIDTAKKGKIELELQLSTAFSASGDVYLTSDNISYGIGYSEVGVDNGGSLKIATVIPQVSITTDVTTFAIGQQLFAVQDITIEELVPGGLMIGSLGVALGAFGLTSGSTAGQITNSMYFVPLNSNAGSAVKIISPKTDKMFNFAGTTATAHADIADYDLKFAVNVASKENPQTIQFQNLKVTVNFSVPNGVYDLYINGTALHATGGSKISSTITANDGFGGYAYTKQGYITVQTSEDQKEKGISNNVIINQDSDIMIVNGNEITMRGPAVYENGRLYIPLRDAMEALGAVNVHWNGTLQIASVEFLDRTVDFTIGKREYYVTGSQFPRQMDAAAMLKASPTTGNTLTYIPFRYLGYAVGLSPEQVNGGADDSGMAFGIYNPIAE